MVNMTAGVRKSSTKTVFRSKLILVSLVCGALITIVLTWTAFSIDNKKLTRALLWQDTILAYLAGPGPTLGHDPQGNPMSEATPIHTLIFPLGFLLSVPIYSVVSYGPLRAWFGIRPDPSQHFD
jgi:hypothetical protein